MIKIKFYFTACLGVWGCLLLYLSPAKAERKVGVFVTKFNGVALPHDSLFKVVQHIMYADWPDDQKLLHYRKAMDAARTVSDRLSIINGISKVRSLQALIFSGRFLNDKTLGPAAATAVATIALSSNDYYGDTIKALLAGAARHLKGGSSGALKKAVQKRLSQMPAGQGWVALFNSRDLTGWKGLVGNPITRTQIDSMTLRNQQAKADQEMHDGWQVISGELLFNGKGNNITTIKQYKDFEMLVDWKIYNDGQKNGDAGIYLRGSPQVQIWDTSRVSSGAQVGSGGLYNNKVNPSIPLKVADNPLGEWNTFRITMKNDRVTVYLNGQLVTDNVVLENYWDRSRPIFPVEQIELQAHGSRVGYREIYIKEM